MGCETLAIAGDFEVYKGNNEFVYVVCHADSTMVCMYEHEWEALMESYKKLKG